MQPNSSLSAADLALTHEPVDAAQSVTGSPTTGAAIVTEFDGLEIGVWETSVGVMTDVEADEVFVVLSGAATVEFDDGTTALTLRAGDVVRLAAGTPTVWTVTETLRKVYLVHP